MARKLVVIDAETDPFLWQRAPKPFLWGFYDGEQFLKFTRTEDLAGFLSQNDFLVYAHNGGKFDYQYLFQYALEGQALKIINGRLGEWRLGKSVMRDSYLIFPQALATTGGKMEVSEDFYQKFEAPVRAAHMPEITEYLKQDCIGLYALVSKFRQDYGPALTLPSAALSFWSKMTGIDKPRSTEAFFQDFSKFYYGGRVECFHPGRHKGPIQSFDIVSAFPKAMLEPQPWGFDVDGRCEGDTWPDESAWGHSFFTVQAKALGQFPWRDENGLHFPHDGHSRTFHVTGWELLACLEAKIDFKILESYTFKSTITFHDYVNYFFSRKQKATKGSLDREIFKVFLNGLYGKFGANPGEYQKYWLSPMNENGPPGYTEADRVFPWSIWQRDLLENERTYLNVATAAGITGAVRARLFRAFVAAFGKDFWRNPDCFYSDTDCIHGRAWSPGNIGKDLGQWQCDFVADKAIYAGKKLYALRAANGVEKIRAKGVSLEWADFEALADGKSVRHQKAAPSYNPRRGLAWLEREVKMMEPEV